MLRAPELHYSHDLGLGICPTSRKWSHIFHLVREVLLCNNFPIEISRFCHHVLVPCSSTFGRADITVWKARYHVVLFAIIDPQANPGQSPSDTWVLNGETGCIRKPISVFESNWNAGWSKDHVLHVHTHRWTFSINFLALVPRLIWVRCVAFCGRLAIFIPLQCPTLIVTPTATSNLVCWLHMNCRKKWFETALLNLRMRCPH